MTTLNNLEQNKEDFSISTRFWAGLCHNCGVCKFANKKPDSTFGKAMKWHREWCPGWAGHKKVYGVKSLS